MAAFAPSLAMFEQQRDRLRIDRDASLLASLRLVLSDAGLGLGVGSLDGHCLGAVHRVQRAVSSDPERAPYRALAAPGRLWWGAFHGLAGRGCGLAAQPAPGGAPVLERAPEPGHVPEETSMRRRLRPMAPIRRPILSSV